MTTTMRWAALGGLVMMVGCAPMQVAAPAAAVEPVAAAPETRAQAAMAAFSGRLRSELG